MNEKRRDERVPIEVEVEVTVPGLFWRKKRILRTRDLSHNGVFVSCEGRQCPPVGTEIEIRLIVRIVEEGMAIEFQDS
jgi:hypothetical protein